MAKPNEAASETKEVASTELRGAATAAVTVAKETVVAKEAGTVKVPPRNVLKPTKNHDVVMGVGRERR